LLQENNTVTIKTTTIKTKTTFFIITSFCLNL